MSTTTAPTPIGTDLVRDKQTVKGFYKEVYEKDAAGNMKFSDYKFVAKAETADKENWAQLEKDGYKPFNSNTVVRYTVKSLAAFSTLITGEDQQVYIAQAGINYLQSTRQNALCIKVKEGTGIMGPDGTLIPPEPENNDEELDMREILNTPPQKTSLSPMEKAQKQLAALKGILPEEDLKNLLLSLAATMSAQAPAEAPATEEVQEVAQ